MKSSRVCQLFALPLFFVMGCSSTAPPPPPVQGSSIHSDRIERPRSQPATAPSPVPLPAARSEAKTQTPAKPVLKTGRVDVAEIVQSRSPPLPALAASAPKRPGIKPYQGEDVQCAAIKVHGLPPTTLISCRNPHRLAKTVLITKLSAEGMSGVPTLDELGAGYLLQPGESRVVLTLKEISPPSSVKFVAKTL